MKVLQAVAIGAVASLCLLQALQTEASEIGRADHKCSCDPQGPAYQLLRGDNQVADCKKGYYCDCARQTRQTCVHVLFIKWKYNEDTQKCDRHFDCEAFFKRTTTPEPTTPEPIPSTPEPAPSSNCTCNPDGPAYQLIRGGDELEWCDKGYYCDCAYGEIDHCEGVLDYVERFDEVDQECRFEYDCAGYLSRSTMEPSTQSTYPATPEPIPSTPEPTPSSNCTCNPDGPAFQLIRGGDELEWCDKGYYCDCAYGEIDHCEGVLDYVERFDEVDQDCRFEYDCAGYLSPSTIEPSTQSTDATTTTTQKPTTTEAPTKTLEPTTTDLTTPEPIPYFNCTCNPDGPAYQLIRGEDELGWCDKGYYCDCAYGEINQCEEWLDVVERFDEIDQDCRFEYDCAGYLRRSTIEPSTQSTDATTTTTEPSTTTREPTTPPEPITTTTPKGGCTCDPEGPAYQLVRGEDEVEACKQGYYCNCRQGKLHRCFNVLTRGWRFNEGAQKCKLFQSCAAVSS